MASKRMRRGLGGIGKHRASVSQEGRLSIDVICVACGGEAAPELPVFLRQTKFWHPEWPILVVTDMPTAAGLTETDKSRIDELVIINPANLPESRSRDYGTRWNKPWIMAKLHALRGALERWPGRGVLLCDSDIVITQRLPALSWHAHVVLSTHIGPHPSTDIPEHHGCYNAGLLLTDNPSVVTRWQELYESGAGTFYEQQCLETLGHEFVVDLFPASWNWGGWRYAESVDCGRDPAILHTHVVGPWADQGTHPSVRVLKERTKAEIARVELAENLPDKWAFIHFPKAAGTSVTDLISSRLGRERGYQNLNSWALGLHRDWSPEEQRLICDGALWGQVGHRHVVHNHAQNWDADVVASMADRGWQFLAFVRPIRDRLLSYFYWCQRFLNEGKPCPMAGPIQSASNVADHLRFLLDDPRYGPEWHFPEWADTIQWWFPADSDGIKAAFADCWQLDVTPPILNTSENPGWKAAIEQGLLPPDLIEQVNSDPRVLAWDRATVRDSRIVWEDKPVPKSSDETGLSFPSMPVNPLKSRRYRGMKLSTEGY